MKKISMNVYTKRTISDVFELFIDSQSAKGLSESTLKNHSYHMNSISKHLNTQMPLDELTKRDVDLMVVSMRREGLAHNTVATYVRRLKTFLNWCNKENLTNIHIDSFREKETVKETYTDDELKALLKRPDKKCEFAEFRSWAIINFFMNCGCRAATVRNIQNKDVDFDTMRVVFRHNKNGKIQVIPLCTLMANILREYMRIRQGEPQDYLFCDVYGGKLTEDALRHAIAKYNRSRGVQSTSIHKFRHTFARKYLVDCGGNAFALQRLMGHSTLAMTKHYCRIFDSDLTKNYDAQSPLAQIQKPKQRITKHP